MQQRRGTPHDGASFFACLSAALGAPAMLLAIASPAAAQPAAPSPAPAASSPSPNPSPSPTPRPLGIRFATTLATTFIDQNTSGPGQIAPEATGFEGGSPLSPNTPYDLFSSAPLVPGLDALGAALETATYETRAFALGVNAGFGSVDGSVQNAAYWGENLLPALNPHLGAQALPYAIAFPTSPGQDDARTSRLSLLGGSFVTADGNLAIKGGYFDLTQTDRFVFAQPALTNVNPAIAYAPAESLSNGLAGTDLWQPFSNALQLDGIDAVAKRGLATLELSNAALPSLPGTAARLNLGSFVIDHGEGTHYSAEYLHAGTSGALFETTIPSGIDPHYLDSPQGTLPTSFLSGQRQTIVGLRATYHVMPGWNLDGTSEVGRAWYDAAPVVHPGTERPGGFYHTGITKHQGRATASLDYFRMEPRYATLILPYGAPENQWSAAFAWPGQWLKSNYQLVDNSVLGVNRQGYRLRYGVDKGPLEVHLEYTNLYQISPETTVTAEEAGYVDGYYLPQLPQNQTLGRQQRYAAWVHWQPAPTIGDLTLDVVDDQLSRPSRVPTDDVSYEVPQAVLTFSRRLSPNLEAALGTGRYGMKGQFSEPIDFAQRLYFAGVTLQETPHASVLATFRRTTFDGSSTFPASPLSPGFTGSLILIEQRYQL